MCKHGERDALPCAFCDQDTIDRLKPPVKTGIYADSTRDAVAERFNANIENDPLFNGDLQTDMEDWVPEMGWEMEDYE